MRLDQRLSTALHLPPPDFSRLQEVEASYDRGGILRTKETGRELQKRTLLAGYRARLMESTGSRPGNK
jgi:hypothetical protein